MKPTCPDCSLSATGECMVCELSRTRGERESALARADESKAAIDEIIVWLSGGFDGQSMTIDGRVTRIKSAVKELLRVESAEARQRANNLEVRLSVANCEIENAAKRLNDALARAEAAEARCQGLIEKLRTFAKINREAADGERDIGRGRSADKTRWSYTAGVLESILSEK